jgi:hypothetical protein
MALAPIVSTFHQIVDLWAIRRMNNAKKAAMNPFVICWTVGIMPQTRGMGKFFRL